MPIANVDFKTMKNNNFRKIPPKFTKEESSVYWRWRQEVGKLVRRDIPKRIDIPLEQSEYLSKYKEGLTPLDMYQYIIYHVMK